MPRGQHPINRAEAHCYLGRTTHDLRFRLRLLWQGRAKDIAAFERIHYGSRELRHPEPRPLKLRPAEICFQKTSTGEIRTRQFCVAQLRAIRDTGFMPEPLMIELAGTRSPTVVAADERIYPLRGILDLLDAVQLSRPANANDFTGAWKAPQAVVCYWLATLAPGDRQGQEVDFLLGDPAGVVRVAAAEAKLGVEDDPRAWAVLFAAIADARQPEMQLFALNSAARLSRPLPAAWRPVLEQLAASRSGGSGNVASASRDLLRKR
jgi:hypothetical protein